MFCLNLVLNQLTDPIDVFMITLIAFRMLRLRTEKRGLTLVSITLMFDVQYISTNDK